MKFSIILCLLFCLAFLGHCVERESIVDLLKRNIGDPDQKQKKKSVDVYFIIDGSAPKRDFELQKKAIKLLGEMVNKLAPVGEGKSALGLIQYSHRDKVKIDVPLGKTKNINQFEKELRNVEQRKGKQNSLTRPLFRANGHFRFRHNKNARLVCLITNWKHTGQRQKPGMPARRLKKESGAKVIVIGIDIEERHVKELQSIATGRNNFMQFATYFDFLKAAKKKDKKKDDA